MYEIRLTTQAKRVYAHLGDEEILRINKVFLSLEKGIFQHNNIKMLKGTLSGYLRYRMGAWRIVFRIDRVNQIVVIESLTTRGGAYRK